MSNIGSLFSQNLGGYLFGIIVVLMAYSALSIWEPQYAATFAVVTLLGIILYRARKG